MIDSLPAANQATVTAGGLAPVAAGNDALDRDAFLRLLVAQLKYQDPLDPADSTEFIAELAQFSSLEQTMGINQRLDLLATQNQGLANTEVVGLVGKPATVRGSLVTTRGNGMTVPLSFTLATDSSDTTVVIRAQSGRAVRTLPLGERSAGLVQLTWDGRDDVGIVQPEGSYAVSVQAKTDTGGPVVVEQETTARISAVSFDQGYPVLHLENGVSVPVSDLLRVDSSNP